LEFVEIPETAESFNENFDENTILSHENDPDYEEDDDDNDSITFLKEKTRKVGRRRRPVRKLVNFFLYYL